MTTLYIHEFTIPEGTAYYASQTKFPILDERPVIRYFNGSGLVEMGPRYYRTPADARTAIEAAGFQAEENLEY